MAGEPGKIFDFNLTLPIIATEFLLLMVILDKTIFGPVGKALDDRDALIRDQLAAVGDNSTAVADLIVRTRNAQRDPLPNPSASSEGERTCPRPARVSGAGDRARSASRKSRTGHLSRVWRA
jgi:F-type H+-transporting ATPase subunit b